MPPILPTVNACLNATAAVLLVLGWRHIRAGRIGAHRNTMVAAFIVSSLFLVCYVVDKAVRQVHTPYAGPGVLRGVYLAVLATHVVLAMAVPILALVMIRLGLRRRDPVHRRLGRWAVPVWLYVSVTGVVIYAMLYVLPPAS